MKKSFCFQNFTITLCLGLYSFIMANGQTVKLPLQSVTFKDKVLERNLSAFIINSKAKVVNVTLEKRSNAYLYKLAGINTYDWIKKYPTSSWGRLGNSTILFYAGTELKDVCTISDTVAYANLLTYLRPYLPNKTDIHTKKYKPDLSLPSEGLEWVFKVENGREVWLYNNNGYDSRDVQDIPIPN